MKSIALSCAMCLFAWWYTGWLPGASAQSNATRPNVLFIAADDLRNDLGCYGHSLVKSPNVDRLAARGVLFERAYCQQAVCNPSRASIMTGMRPDALRIWDLPTHFRSRVPDVVTLPQFFMQHGYFTQNIGKIYHNFRQSIEGDPASWNVPAVMHFANHGSDVPQFAGSLPKNYAVHPKCEQRDLPDGAYFDGRVAQLATAALQQLKQQSQPFFLAVGFWKPHSPFNAPKRYWDMYRRDEVPLADAAHWPLDAPRIAWHDSREMLGANPQVLSPESAREIRHGYLANISYFDAQLGKVLDALDRLGLANNTIVVLWSDHGYHLGEHTLWAKTSNFELDARVPLIVADPRASGAGRRTRAIVELLDLYPTLAELCGLPKPQSVAGISFSNALDRNGFTGKPGALTQHPRPAYYDREPSKAPTAMGYSVRSERFRYTEWRNWQTGETEARELYDHSSDSRETKNLAHEPEFASDIQRGAELLNSFSPIVKPGWQPPLPENPAS